MAIVNYSTGFLKAIAATGSFKNRFDSTLIGNIYSGTTPANADAAATGTLLGVLSINADGTTELILDTVAVDGNGRVILAKPSGTVWGFVGLGPTTGAVYGVAGYCRFFNDGTDTPTTISATAERIDVQITQSGGVLNMSDLNVVTGAQSNVNSFQFVFQAQASN